MRYVKLFERFSNKEIKQLKPEIVNIKSLPGVSFKVMPLVLRDLELPDSSDFIKQTYSATDVAFLGTERFVVLVDIFGILIPFYTSSGEAGKKSVKIGKFYNIWGMTGSREKIDWLNKGTESDIINYYNIPLFNLISNELETVVNKSYPGCDAFGDALKIDKFGKNIINGIVPEWIFSENTFNLINKDMKPSSKGKHQIDYEYIENIKKRLQSSLPEKYKSLVKMGRNYEI
jgi:hypothetical protein